MRHLWGPVNENGSTSGMVRCVQMYSPVTMFAKISSDSIGKIEVTKVRSVRSDTWRARALREGGGRSSAVLSLMDDASQGLSPSVECASVFALLERNFLSLFSRAFLPICNRYF